MRALRVGSAALAAVALLMVAVAAASAFERAWTLAALWALTGGAAGVVVWAMAKVDRRR